MDEKHKAPTDSLDEEGHHENVPFEKSEAEKRYVRKLNSRLLPLAMLVIFLQFIDKSILGVAAVLGIFESTHITLSQYSWLGAFFYLGYFAFQIPNNILLQKFPIGKYLGFLLTCWGIITIGTGFAKNFTQLAILRVFLGVFEAGSYPAMTIIFNSLYRRSEQSACFGFIWLSNGLAGVVGSALAVAIAGIPVRNGIFTWQWGYIIWGSVTTIVGIVCFFLLIDSPKSKLLTLTEEEKEIVELRILDNAVVRKQTVEVHQYWEALREPRLWILFIVAAAQNLQTGGLVSYSTILVSGLGFNSTQAIWLQIPGGSLTVIFIAMAVFIQRRTKQTIFTATLCYAISAIGNLLLAVLPGNTNQAKLLGLYLTWAQMGAYVMIVTLIGSTVSGYSKKIFYNGSNMIAYTIGNFGGPLTLVAKYGPAYVPTMWVFFAVNIFNIFALLTLRYLLARINKKRELERTPERTDVYLNLTDKEDKNYVYAL